MGLHLGATPVDRLYLGSDPVDAVYLGADRVWPPEPVGPVPGVFTGGTVHDADGYRYHTFTSSGTLDVVEPGFADVLVVDGGAGGAGGGGGGGMVWEQFEVMIATSQPVTVGAGGAAIQLSPEIVDAQPGGASALGSLVVGGSAGQGGSTDYEDILTADGRDGTTGGGGSGAGQPVGAGGAGAAGGDGGAGGSNATGGGGGAGGDGGAAGGGDQYQGGNGGVGVQSVITGDWYGGGGGGAGAAGGAGGTGGGGKGSGTTAAEPGATNTGGGGGGGGPSLAGREGGSGIVVIRTATP